jgi:oligopeptide/dipeptide ABC transporter ATP-binding protein
VSEDVVLAVERLETHFFASSGSVAAVDGVSFELRKGETLGLVGESGCGKSVTALSIVGLIPPRAGRVVGGSVRYGGVDLLTLDDDALQHVRGKEISMIFQEPMTALNPVLTIGYQIAEAIRLHEAIDAPKARERAIGMLRLVQIADPERRFGAYPHELSGGMRQRAMIAMALACNPKVLIADEPTTALDVTIQAQILELIVELQEKLGTAVIMITHDLGVIAETAHRVAVMYAGRVVEDADVEDLFAHPRHPYTAGLLRAIPRLGSSLDERAGQRLLAIEGTVPSLRNRPPGCAFAPRCALASEVCHREAPPREAKATRHFAACWNSPPDAAGQ